jgi:hypothetical protein
VRRSALSLLVAATRLATALPAAHAHLLPGGASSLLGMMAAADGMLVARAAAPTHERGTSAAATPFLLRQAIAGDVPEDAFVLEQKPPLLRYAEVQDALLLVAHEADAPGRWVSVQPAGAGIVLATPVLDERSRTVLVALWKVAHAAPGAAPDVPAAVAALVDALSLPEQKIRALAFLDLSTLGDDPSHFPPVAVTRLLRYGDAPGDDAQLAPAVRDLAKRIAARQAAPGAAASTGATIR